MIYDIIIYDICNIYDMTWYMIYDMTWYDVWYDMVYDMIWYNTKTAATDITVVLVLLVLLLLFSEIEFPLGDSSSYTSNK